MFQFHYSHLSKIIICPFEAEIVEEGKKKLIWPLFGWHLYRLKNFDFDWNLQSDCRFLMLVFIFFIIASAILFYFRLFIYFYFCVFVESVSCSGMKKSPLPVQSVSGTEKKVCGKEALVKLLRWHFGHAEFRGRQLEAIEAILSGMHPLPFYHFLLFPSKSCLIDGKS